MRKIDVKGEIDDEYYSIKAGRLASEKLDY